MSGVDAFFSGLKKKFRDKEDIDWESDAPRLADLVRTEITESKVAHEYNKLVSVLGRGKDVRILDYGCGGGGLLLFSF